MSATQQRLVAVLLAAIVVLLGHSYFRDAYQLISVAVFPDANRAYEYGEAHLTAREGDYNIALAEYFFREAYRLNQDLPYVLHELARISFLRGRLDLALTQINLQILSHGSSTPNSYYVRGLIEGYMGKYAAAEADYAYFVQSDPSNWAAMNDYAWVLLKAGNPTEALKVTARGTSMYPNNPWLLNSLSIAQYELGSLQDALSTAQRAVAASQTVTRAQWLTAYPGNDPKSAAEGIASLQASALNNMHSIEAAIASSTVQ
ncbi:MAG TPA: tetratricopeptide repeat protein [Candidatus Paceibacterota bacterium]|nr:tetratricopeptide repeat protein [Candidatus Paceibacterota bacterium]